MAELKNSKYIVSELKIPESKQKIAKEYAKYATRILWLDDKVVEPAFTFLLAITAQEKPRFLICWQVLFSQTKAKSV